VYQQLSVAEATIATQAAELSEAKATIATQAAKLNQAADTMKRCSDAYQSNLGSVSEDLKVRLPPALCTARLRTIPTC
jgi:multidrug resistance efflux pump